MIIAIDGPAGSGKSTISKLLATRLGIGYLDTGAMYRSLTWYALEEGLDLDDHESVVEAANRMPLVMNPDPVSPSYFVDGVEITRAIREPRIALAIPAVSTNLLVRKWMAFEQRRRMMEARESGSGMIAEGRDITTVVCPDADERLRRRTLELHGEATPELMESVREQITKRDTADATVSEFMTPAEGVEVVDSSGLGIEGVAEEILTLVDRNLESRAVI